MDNHPAPAELEGFVLSRLAPERVRAVIAHLAQGCDECRSIAGGFLCLLMGPGEPPEVELTPQEDAAYEGAFERAIAVALQKEREVFEERKRAAFSLLSDPNLAKLPEIPRHLRGLPLFEALLERSWSLRHENPEQMVQLADLARLLAERLKGDEFEGKPGADYQCRAWIELGNAYRVADDLQEADQALGRATELLFLGTRDELIAARLFDVQASLYGSRRRFDLAATSLELVFAIHSRRGDEHLAGRALISKGIYAGYQGDAEEAIRLIGEGLGLVDASREPRLVFLALHNQARLLVDCGRFQEARRALFDLYRRRLDHGGRVNELKVRWVEGHINAGLGKMDRAERDLREVQRGFADMDLDYKAALAGLELGAVLIRLNRLDEACATVIPAAAVFMAKGIDREAAASVLLLHQTFEKKMADPVLLDYVIGLLRGLEDGGKRAEPPVEC